MSEITASVTSAPITASASGGSVTAKVGVSTMSVSASGGLGPAGPAGPQGSQGPQGSTSIAGAGDVALETLSDGDLLRYSSQASKWINANQTLITDGGNFLILLSLLLT